MNRLPNLGAHDGDSRAGSQSIAEGVFAVLKRSIVELRLKPGDSFSEAEVARQLGVSRQPVREAFIKLAEVGLVDIRPKRGTSVRLISRREVENARFIREAIERAVVRRAAESATGEQIDRIQDMIDAQVKASDAGDLAGFMHLDDRFHEAVAEAGECEHAWHIVEDLKVQFDRVRFLSLPDATPMPTIIEQHRAIADGIARHDAAAAEEAMRRHLTEVLTSLPRIAATRAEWFVA